MSEAASIFLSYRSIEAEFALKLAADLKNSGVRLWMDRLDGIQVGMDWRDAIQGAINACAALIAVLSPEYIRAEYCKKELARANALHRPIFPLLLYPVKEEEVPLALAGVQYEDFTDWRDEKKYAAHFDKLLARLKKETADQIGAVPDAETRYLTTLIAELEAARGVLQYVALAGQMDRERPQEMRPQPPPVDEWGFAELVRSRPESLSEGGLDDQPDSPSPTRLERGHDAQHRGGEVGREERIPLKNIAEAVSKHPRFVLIGDPGAGKTTTLRKLALDAARARLDNPRTAPIPLLLYLPQWDSEPTPADFVRSRWESWKLGGDVAGMLARGDVLLYLDGLNEMGANGPRRAKQIAAWFCDPGSAPARAVVTCRAGDYAGDDLRLGEMPTVLAQDLDEAQIRQFAANYLKEQAEAFLARVQPESKRERESERSLLWRVPMLDPGALHTDTSNRSLLRLARNPYMLSALMIVYEQGGDLPKNTGALFHGLIRALWKREELRGTTGGIPFEQAEQAFARLAFAMINKYKPLDVPQRWVLRRLAGWKWRQVFTGRATELLQMGVNANYVIVSGGQVRFYHQLIQETFAAVGLGHVRVELNRVKPFDNKWEMRISPRWHQVVIALCGVGDAEATIAAVLKTDPFLAGRCVASGVKAGAAQQVVVDRLVNMLRYANEDMRENAVRALGEIGDAHAVEPLIAILRDENWDMRRNAVDALVKIGSLAVEPLITALHDVDEIVRDGVAEVLVEIGSLAVGRLIAALHDENQSVRSEAASALGQIGDRSAVEPLIAALHDESQGVRSEATGALGRIGALAVEPLIAALSDTNEDLRQGAAAALGQIGHAQVVNAPLAARHYIKKNTFWVSLDEVMQIVAPAVEPLIAALHDTNEIVRLRAAEALREIGDVRAVAPLIAALGDADEVVRQSAAWALERIATPEALAAVEAWRE